MRQERERHAPRACPPQITRSVHGRCLACFRTQQRFRSSDCGGQRGRSAAPARQRLPMMCDCAHHVLQCHLQNDGETRLSEVEDSYYQRMRKWSDKFDSYAWHLERICHKWKENQQKFAVHQEAMDFTHDPAMMAISPPLIDRASSISSRCIEDQGKHPSPGKAGVKQAWTNFTNAAEVLLLSRQFDGLLRAGIPPHLRGQVWWMCSGAQEKRSSSGESYVKLIERLPTLNKCIAMDIEKDLPRTFPQQQSVDASDLCSRHISELRRVLQAYSLRNPQIGYCQSMNFLAAVLLHHMEEEEAFWVLVAMLEELIPQFHTRTMSGSRAEQRVFADLVQQKLPVLFSHMQHLGVDFLPFTLKWFLCLFLNTLPFEPVLRLWDVFFCEGSHVLLRMGLTLLKLHQPLILACDDAIDVYEMFQVSHKRLQQITSPYRTGLLNRDECVCDTLIRLVMDKNFIGSIPFDTLHELRLFYRLEIEDEVKKSEERRRLNASNRMQSGRKVSSNSTVERSGADHEQPVPRSPDDAELQEYDFVDEYSGQELDMSPTKYIHFRDLYDSADGSDYFIDVKYEVAVQQ